MEEMQKYSIKAFLLLASFIAPVSVIENSWAEESNRDSSIPHTQLRYEVLAKLSESSKISIAPALFDTASKKGLPPLALAGLKKFDVVFEDLDQDASKCGFVSDKLEQVVRDTLSQANIDLVYKYSPEANATIYLSVNALSDCTTNYTLGVFTNVTLKDSGNFSYARVWWTEGLRNGGLNPASDLEKQISEGTKMLVRDWKIAND